ncbi:MAG: type II toxin-antitoxin system RelE/ParE family toxin [Clostridia bacterium]|nr:type II toxin-antitoxin system RelE/ParE family toxin [Clostridia bacterium]
MEISISNRAQSNIENITEFTLKISTNYANRVINEIYSTIYSIKDAPYIGRYVPEISDKHYRERICGNYRIIYVVSEKHNTIYIRYIISGKQNSNLFFEVHKKEIFNFLNRLFS